MVKIINKEYVIHSFDFDGESSDIIDSVGSAVGVANGAIRVPNGEGKALQFDGVDDYALFNEKITPIGKRSISFSVKVDSVPSAIQYIYSNVQNNSFHGEAVYISSVGRVGWFSFRGVAGSPRFSLNTTVDLADGKWHDILLTWDGTFNTNGVKAYVDNMEIPNAQTTANTTETASPQLNFLLGATYASTTTYSNHFKGELSNFKVYNEVISFLPDKTMVLKNLTTNKHYSLADKTLILLPNGSDETVNKNGIEAGKEIQLDEAFDKVNYVQDEYETLGSGRVFKIPITYDFKTIGREGE